MTRILGVDLGTRRIGLALSDPSGTIATPLRVLEREAEHRDDHEAIVRVAQEQEASRIVVGWPRSLSGREGPAALAVRDEVRELESVAGESVEVELHDERFSTVTATQRLREARPARGRGRPKPRLRRPRPGVDAAAAAVFLQSYLDAAAAARETP